MMNTMTSPATTRSASDLHVLVVDDDQFTRELLASMLRKQGVLQVTLATDGERGLAALQGQSAPDLVICDLNMPGKDGFQMMEGMAAARYKGAVVMLSGMQQRVLNSAGVMARFHQLNVLGVVAKPVSRDGLATLLGQARQARSQHA